MHLGFIFHIHYFIILLIVKYIAITFSVQWKELFCCITNTFEIRSCCVVDVVAGTGGLGLQGVVDRPAARGVVRLPGRLHNGPD